MENESPFEALLANLLFLIAGTSQKPGAVKDTNVWHPYKYAVFQ